MATKNISLGKNVVSDSLEIELYRAMVQLGGGTFRELWDLGYETLILFDSPQTHLTLAVPVSVMSASEVRRRIVESDDFHLFLRDLENHQWARR